MYYFCRKSASCTHVSAVLHALANLNPPSFRLKPNVDVTIGEEEEEMPCTSVPRQWGIPSKKRKDSSIEISNVVFEKHDYSKPVKKRVKLIEDFDPRPPECIGTVQSQLPELLDKIKEEKLCISLLLDPSYQNELSSTDIPADYNLPNSSGLAITINAFKNSINLSCSEAREIERNTREQNQSSLWFSMRRYRITASLFGSVLSRKPDTPPDNLVLRILHPRKFSSIATKHGIDNETSAIKAYIDHQQNHGHPGLVVCSCGFFINTDFPFLGATPDGSVYDPSEPEQPFGYLEVKCPYSVRDLTPVEACSTQNFYCSLDSNGNLKLKENHQYYAQIQGQMAVGERTWCDFVVYTQKGCSIQRIYFNKIFWDNLLSKLTTFYDNCVVPEIVSPMHSVGLPVRDLSKV